MRKVQNVKPRIISMGFCVFLLMNSCVTYKTVSIDQVKNNKIYQVTLVNDKQLTMRSDKVEKDAITFKVNDNLVVFPKSEINDIKKKKTPVLRFVGGIAIGTLAVLYIANNQPESTFDKAVPN